MKEENSLVSLMRVLSDPQLSTYDLIAKKLNEIGFEPLKLNIPVRKDIVKFTGTTIYKKGDVTIYLSSGEGREAGHSLSHISISAMDKTASLEKTVSGVAHWLGAQPEYPAKAAQFAIIENENWTPIPLVETKHWPAEPKGALAHISVQDMGFGVSITRIVQRTT